MAQSYFFAGGREEGIEAARAYARVTLSLEGDNNPDILIFRYGLFSVEDARKVISIADQAAVGEHGKLIVIAPERIFHEAQNALLKVFEEPPPATTLVLIVPSSGVLIRTLRSRLLPLGEKSAAISEEAKTFIAASASEREKIVSKLLDRAKSDKDEEKQAARGEALRLAEGLLAASYERYREKADEDALRFAEELDAFIPILHERSAPLKLIFEHVSIVLPKL